MGVLILGALEWSVSGWGMPGLGVLLCVPEFSHCDVD